MIVFGKERDYVVHDDKNIKGFFGPYRFLSNYHIAPVVYEDVEYPSTEAAYQAAKSLDPEIRKQFINLNSNEAKKLGQKIEVRPDWEDVKYGVMLEVCTYKFTKHSDLREALILTGDKYIEETNHWRDTTWGVCKGEGKNWLGKILMEIRKTLK
jgi:ribA/ribD-fused uncharacterized protein